MTVLQELQLKMLEISNLDDRVQVLIITGFVNSLLVKEKDQIIKAFDTANNINTGNYQTGEDYYNSTYPSRITE